MSNTTMEADNAVIWQRDCPYWQGPGPRYVEDMPRKVVLHKKCKKKVRSRSQSPVKYAKPRPENLGAEATIAYVKTVKKTFSRYPEIYNAFMRILREIKEEKNANIIEIIEKVILLFDGYPDLIFSFNAFLPSKYEIQMQEDAVVIRVFDANEQGGIVDCGSNKMEFEESMAYIREVKRTYSYVPERYGKFMEILDNFHSKRLTEIEAIRKVVQLFKGHPNLILGFNQFLPQGYIIHMYSKSSYAIECPGHADYGDRIPIDV